jgi:hypothetical protein
MRLFLFLAVGSGVMAGMGSARLAFEGLLWAGLHPASMARGFLPDDISLTLSKRLIFHPLGLSFFPAPSACTSGKLTEARWECS